MILLRTKLPELGCAKDHHMACFYQRPLLAEVGDSLPVRNLVLDPGLRRLAWDIFVALADVRRDAVTVAPLSRMASMYSLPRLTAAAQNWSLLARTPAAPSSPYQLPLDGFGENLSPVSAAKNAQHGQH